MWINALDICNQYNKDCPDCVQTLAAGRRHVKRGLGDESWTMSADLSGPHPQAIATDFVYMMIVVIRLEKGKNLPFIRGLTSKEASGIVTALKGVFAELRSIFGMLPPINRFHTDGGGEFINHKVEQFLKEQGVFKTSTDGKDPQGNGLAERYVGIIKQRACSYLAHAGLGLRFWYWASLQAAFVYRSTILGVGLPKDGVPTFGHRVLVRKPGDKATKSELSFLPKKEEALFLCWDSSVVNGAYVGLANGMGLLTTRKVSAPTPWPNDSVPTWRIITNPVGHEKVWVSSEGTVLWNTPKDGDILTFEQRSIPDHSSGIKEKATAADLQTDRDWRRFKHGLPTEESMNDLKRRECALTRIQTEMGNLLMILPL